MRRRKLPRRVLLNRAKPRMKLEMPRRRPLRELRLQMATRRRSAGVEDVAAGEEAELEARRPERRRLPYRLAWKKTDRRRRRLLCKMRRRQ